MIPLTKTIGISNRYFQGHYNGQEHYVTLNLLSPNNGYYVGLFGRIMEASVRYATIYGSVTITHFMGSPNSTAGITGTAIRSTIEYCRNYAVINGYTNDHVGGIAGDAAFSEINNCVNLGNVEGFNNIGGIVGRAS